MKSPERKSSPGAAAAGHMPCVPLPLDPKSNSSVPKLPPAFETRVEWTQITKNGNSTSEMWEYFDGPGNIGAVTFINAGEPNSGFIYNYNTSEVFELTPTALGTQCKTLTLEEAALRDNLIMGFNRTGKGGAHISSSSGIFHFGRQFHERYEGLKMVRGILTHHWQTCVHVEEFFNTTALVDYYFADPFWTMPDDGFTYACDVRPQDISGLNIIDDITGNVDDHWPAFAEFGYPVMSHWSGVMADTQQPGSWNPINFTYHFFSFRDEVTDRLVFQTPPLTYCPTRKSTKPPPNVPNAFSYKQEMLQTKSKLMPENVIRQVSASYDYPKKLVKMEYTQLGSTDYGSDLDQVDPIREVHDFYTGIRYRIDTSTMFCELLTLPQFGADTAADGEGDDKWKFLRQKDSKEFLDLDANYTYVGQRKERGATVDVWVAQKDDWPMQGNHLYRSIFEWQFLADDWWDKAGESYEYDVPFRLHVRTTSVIDSSTTEYVYNFFDFDNRAPKMTVFDVTSCIDLIKRKHLEMRFEGKFWDDIFWKGLKETFEEQLWMGLAGTMNTSLLRIQELEFDYDVDSKQIVTQFVVLDAPELKGNIKNLPVQVPLETAIKLLETTIESNLLTITLDQTTAQGEQTIEVVPIKGSLKDLYPGPTAQPFTVCTPFKHSTSDLPHLPDQFETYIVWTQKHFNRTINLHEWYDHGGDRGRVEIIEHSFVLDQIYDFNTQELHQIIGDLCISSNIREANQDELFFGSDEGVDNRRHIKVPAGIFHFGGDFKEKYLGKEFVRGIMTDHWQACVFAPELSNTTAVVDWYFSDPTYMMPQGLKSVVPVRATWKGTALDKKKNETYEVDHIYDYIKFTTGFLSTDSEVDDLFETPPMVYCQGRKSITKTPEPKQSFAAKIEIIIPSSVLDPINTMQTVEYYFDEDLELTRADYIPMGLGTDNVYGTNPLSIVHDFNSGISYVQDKLQGNCTVTKIDPDDTDVEPSHINKMINVKEMFAFDKGNWTYTGTRKVRGIECNIWIGNRTDWPKHQNFSEYSILEWAFATKEWHEIKEVVEPVPIALDVITYFPSPFDGYKKRITYHYSAYNEQPMLYTTFDIRECAGALDHKEFAMLFPMTSDAWDFVIGLPNVAKFMIYKELADKGIISPIRFFDVELEYIKERGELEVTFSILEDPDPKLDPAWKTSIAEVFAFLTQSIVNGELTVDFYPTNEEPLIIKATSIRCLDNDLIPTTGPTTGPTTVTTLVTPVTTPLTTPVTEPPWEKPHPVTPGKPDLLVCTPKSPKSSDGKTIFTSEPPLPNLPPSFQTDVELNQKNRNKTIQLNEYYDEMNNKGKIRIVNEGIEVFIVYDYNTKEIFQIISDNCTTINPNTTKKEDLIFGWEEGPGGSIKISPTSGIFHFGKQYSEKYVGTEFVRGIKTNHWTSCVFAPELDNVTAIVDWYFAVEDWVSSMGPLFAPVPVRAHWRGTRVNAQDPYTAFPFESVYEYSNFLPGLEVDPSVFNTPPGVYCEGRKAERAKPTVPTQFKMGVEVIQPRSIPMPVNIIHSARFWFDNHLNLSRVDYKPVSQIVTDIGSKHEMSEIYDYKNRLIYVQDLFLGNCSVLPLKDGMDIADIITHAKNNSYRTPMDFFDLSQYDYSYTGERPIRDGARADVWIAKRTDWPPGSDGKFESTFEWAFLTDDWIDSEGETVELDVPLELHIRTKLVSNPDVTYEQIHNVFAFDSEEPQAWDFDIRECLPQLETRHFSFSFDGKFWDQIGKYTTRLEYAIYAALSSSLQLSPLRIEEILYSKNKKGELQVFVTMIEKPSVTPIQPKMARTSTFVGEHEDWLEEIADRLQHLVKTNAFHVTLAIGWESDLIIMTALPDSFEEMEKLPGPVCPTTAPTTTPTTTPAMGMGAMLGITIVISLLVAGFLSMLINYIILKRSTGAGASGGGGPSGGTSMTSFTNRMFNPNGGAARATEPS